MLTRLNSDAEGAMSRLERVKRMLDRLHLRDRNRCFFCIILCMLAALVAIFIMVVTSYARDPAPALAPPCGREAAAAVEALRRSARAPLPREEAPGLYSMGAEHSRTEPSSSASSPPSSSSAPLPGAGCSARGSGARPRKAAALKRRQKDL
ncbi:unnamed protein product [Prorocentrum cordatum]|uniref:Uncharacterized protein n=1 Tax=Prorocentrum cordatum TaxID=2364126 RepID=A0ABN9TDZ5_9DINO|nr:unnamed protein product [Polarella glacialis]